MMKNKEIIIAVILGLAIVGYAIVNQQTKLKVIEEEERVKWAEQVRQKDWEEQKKQEKEFKIAACRREVVEEYILVWRQNCKNHGSNIERDVKGEIKSCSLPTYIADGLGETRKQDEDRCMEMYK